MKTMQPEWVVQMARELVCGITAQMADIHLSSVPKIGKMKEQMVMVGVCALIGGDSTFSVRLCSEKSLIMRLVRNMTGLEASEEDVRDYAIEFFNTLCGRFISEIINKNKMKARILRISYESPHEWKEQEKEEKFVVLDFVSEENEYVSFSWNDIAF